MGDAAFRIEFPDKASVWDNRIMKAAVVVNGTLRYDALDAVADDILTSVVAGHGPAGASEDDMGEVHTGSGLSKTLYMVAALLPVFGLAVIVMLRRGRLPRKEGTGR